MKVVINLFTLFALLSAPVAFSQSAVKPEQAVSKQSQYQAKSKKLSRAEIDRLLAKPEKLLFIDLRRPDEVSKIGGFPVYLNIQFADLEKSLAFIPKDRTIVTLSNHSGRSLKGADLLADKGFNVAGGAGVQDYEAEGGTLLKVAVPIPTAQNTAAPAQQQRPQISAEEALQKFSFFITSVGSGKGANLGGLSGADAHCQSLAKAVGAGNKIWRAYLSTQAADGKSAINARDRIGKGPWYNVKGALIANDVGHLHGDTIAQAQLGSNLSRNQALNEKGERVLAAGDTPNQHDILTGSKVDGKAFTDAADHTCKNYTSAAADGSVQVGHFDRTGGGNASWNSAHPSRGCGQDNLVATGGAGLFYCFVAN